MFPRPIPVFLFAIFLFWVAAFNNPPDVPVWCGKAYLATNSSFDPGGWLDAPSPNPGPDSQRLALSVYSRYSFYTDGEESVGIVVDTPVLEYGGFGAPFVNETAGNGTTGPLKELVVRVWNDEGTWVEDERVPVDVRGWEIEVNMAELLATRTSNGSESVLVYQVEGKSPDGKQTFSTELHIEVLPERNDGGSMARVDRVTGGISTKSPGDEFWSTLFYVGFYTRWDWISWLIDPANNPEPTDLASYETNSLKEYRDRGYNIIHPVPPGGDASFDDKLLEAFLKQCDELGLYVMYDMRHTYLNLTSIQGQLPRLQNHTSLLLYYTGDEPDGATDPLNGTRLAYDKLKEIDPYHPVSLVLNCYNFYFEEYTSGADIILEDTYPIILNSSYSTVHDTPCNRTYGDCGCDLCHVNDTAFPEFVTHPFQDVVDRVDNFYEFQQWIGTQYTKPVWGVPQWFFDKDFYWERWATREEAVVMVALRVNHGAKGVVGWIFPTSHVVLNATTDVAKVLTQSNVASLLLDGKSHQLESEVGEKTLDAVAWVGGEAADSQEMLIIIAQPEKTQGSGETLKLPTNVTGLEALFGPAWSHEDGSDLISKDSVGPLEVTILKATVGQFGY